MEDNLNDSIDRLRRTIETNNSYWNNFVRGIFGGFGFFIGSAVLVALTIYLLTKINTVPIVGKYINDVLNELQKLRGGG